MGFADRCHLKIPFPSWARDNKDKPEQDFENWKEVQRWADDFYQNCMPEPSTSASEHFRFIINDYVTTATTGVFEVIPLSDSASGAFASDGVSLAADIITLPVGKWLLGVTIEATWWSGQPTSGDYHIGFDLLTPHHPWLAHLRYTDYDWTGSAPTFVGSNLYDITAADQTARLRHFTDSGETSSLYGMVWGLQVA